MKDIGNVKMMSDLHDEIIVWREHLRTERLSEKRMKSEGE